MSDQINFDHNAVQGKPILRSVTLSIHTVKNYMSVQNGIAVFFFFFFRVMFYSAGIF